MLALRTQGKRTCFVIVGFRYSYLQLPQIQRAVESSCHGFSGGPSARVGLAAVLRELARILVAWSRDRARIHITVWK